MLTKFTLLTLVLSTSFAMAQDPGAQAAQQASQMATQAAQQASEMANQQMMQASQQANQNMMQSSQLAAQNTPNCYRCGEVTPKFSVKSGAYSSAVTVKMRDRGRGAVIYYTTDGWTPTAASTRYIGPIKIDSTTSLQAIAISPYGGRSRVATAVYMFAGTAAGTAAGSSATGPVAIGSAAIGSAAGASSGGASSALHPSGTSDSSQILLARGTPVPFVFAADLSSKTADVGDKVSMTLADDLRAGDVIVAKKGTPSLATVTEVDRTGMGGMPGEVYFQVDSLQVGDTSIKLRGTAAKEGQYKVGKAIGLMMIPMVPVGVFVHGTDAVIKQGASFTATVDADTVLPAAKLPTN